MRIGEVLKLRANNVNDRKLFLLDPKSGRQIEIVFIPKKVADRLRGYIATEGIEEDNRVFPLGYQTVFIDLISISVPGLEWFKWQGGIKLILPSNSSGTRVGSSTQAVGLQGPYAVAVRPRICRWPER